MWCGIVTLFPEMFRALTDFGITGRAIKKEILTLNYWNPRDFADDKHKTVDDRPYGGGPGMVMRVSPLRETIQAAKSAAPGPVKTVYLSPTGKKLQHKDVVELAKEQNLIFIAGRYEGIDERLLQLEVDQEWSLGDYVVSGGELPIMIMIDAIIRFLPGSLGDENSPLADSFVDSLLDCPHYTRPEQIDGLSVPSVLLSGDHVKIEQWRHKQKLGRTYLKRPDLLQGLTLTEQDKALLQEYLIENQIA